MQITSLDPQPRSYAGEGVLLSGAQRLLFLTAQVPEAPDGSTPDGFEAQARLAWQNLLGVLERAGMTERNLVRITIYLADRGFREDNARIRHEVLGDHCPALTAIITGVLYENWLLAIEAVAAA